MVSSSTHILHNFAVAMDKQADKVLQKETGISYARFYCLSVIAEEAKSSQRRIASITGYSNAATSKMVGALQSEDLITVTVDPSHSRRHIVKLSKKGHTILHEGEIALDKCFRSITEESEIDEDNYIQQTKKLITVLTQK